MREKYGCGRKYENIEMRAVFRAKLIAKIIRGSILEKNVVGKKIRYERSVLGKTELEKKAETGPVQGIYIIVTYSQAKINSDCCS